MKIDSVKLTKIYTVETDMDDSDKARSYTRYGPSVWTVCRWGGDVVVEDCKNLEAMFQEYLLKDLSGSGPVDANIPPLDDIEKYWLCCGSVNRLHPQSRCVAYQRMLLNPLGERHERCRYGTAKQHSEFQKRKDS